MRAADALLGSVWGVSSTHEAWASSSASVVHDADQTITRTASVSIQTFELARDGTMIACAGGAIVIVDAAGESRTDPTTLVADVLRCRDVAIAAHDDAWAMLGTTVLHNPQSGAICHLHASAWSCTALDRPAVPRTLVVTAEHVWWVAEPTNDGLGAQLLVFDRTTPATTPVVMLDHFDAGVSLRASPASESVVVVPPRSATDQSVQRITSDGSVSTLVASTEGTHADVWITADDRVLALEVLTGGTYQCSSGVLGYGSGCGESVDWTQLVVWELGAGAPRELAHATYDGGGQASIGVERTAGTFVAGDRWYALP